MYRVTQRIRVEWAHCDPAGIIFNPNYYIWMDQGTHQLLEAVGYPFAEKVRNTAFAGCPLVTSSAEFLLPAFYSDVITLASEAQKFGTKSFTVAHLFWRGDDLLARGQEVRVWAVTDDSKDGRMTGIPVPDDVRVGLSKKGERDVSP